MQRTEIHAKKKDFGRSAMSERQKWDTIAASSLVWARLPKAGNPI